MTSDTLGADGVVSRLVDVIRYVPTGPTDPIDCLRQTDVCRFAAALGQSFSTLDEVLAFARQHAEAILAIADALEVDALHD